MDADEKCGIDFLKGKAIHQNYPDVSLNKKEVGAGPGWPALADRPGASSTGRPEKIVHEPCTTVQGERIGINYEKVYQINKTILVGSL